MDSSFDAVVVGGGFAGLSCAVALAEAGKRAVVLEKKPHLGGRAFSFKDQETGVTVDNGQHLFMGCYRQTLDFLARIGTADRLTLLPDIRVDFADKSGGRDALVCPAVLGSPLHLAAGVVGLKKLGFLDKIKLLKLDRALRSMLGKAPVPAALDRMTVRQWMDSLGQTRRMQERLFDPIALGALNDAPEVAAATGFAQVLREAFYTDVESTRLGVANVGLSDLYTEAAKGYIERRGGQVLTGKKIKAIKEGRVICDDGQEFRADSVVASLPPWDLKKLDLPAELRGSWENLKPAPIVSLTIWLDRPVLSENFVGMLGTTVQWVFNKSRIMKLEGEGQCLSLVISGAHGQVSADPKDIFATAKEDMGDCFPEFKKATIKRWKVVKEPFATLSPAPGSDAMRPGAATAVPGIYLAGDWTQTGLPATIESAVASGRKAAELIVNGGKHAQVR